MPLVECITLYPALLTDPAPVYADVFRAPVCDNLEDVALNASVSRNRVGGASRCFPALGRDKCLRSSAPKFGTILMQVEFDGVSIRLEEYPVSSYIPSTRGLRAGGQQHSAHCDCQKSGEGSERARNQAQTDLHLLARAIAEKRRDSES
jgi:hypothetical protein